MKINKQPLGGKTPPTTPASSLVSEFQGQLSWWRGRWQDVSLSSVTLAKSFSLRLNTLQDCYEKPNEQYLKAHKLSKGIVPMASFSGFKGAFCLQDLELWHRSFANNNNNNDKILSKLQWLLLILNKLYVQESLVLKSSSKW